MTFGWLVLTTRFRRVLRTDNTRLSSILGRILGLFRHARGQFITSFCVFSTLSALHDDFFGGFARPLDQVSVEPALLVAFFIHGLEILSYMVRCGQSVLTFSAFVDVNCISPHLRAGVFARHVGSPPVGAVLLLPLWWFWFFFSWRVCLCGISVLAFGVARCVVIPWYDVTAFLLEFGWLAVARILFSFVAECVSVVGRDSFISFGSSCLLVVLWFVCRSPWIFTQKCHFNGADFGSFCLDCLNRLVVVSDVKLFHGTFPVFASPSLCLIPSP